MHLHDNVIITLQNGRLRKFRLHARQLQVAVVSGVDYIQWLDGTEVAAPAMLRWFLRIDNCTPFAEAFRSMATTSESKLRGDQQRRNADAHRVLSKPYHHSVATPRLRHIT